MEMVNESANIDITQVTATLILVCCSLYLRLILEAFGQSWVKTKAHTGTLLVLPLIVYVITNVISGNIALSLGMVGALSIVRFRNPVRSPIELAAYFCAITLGIASAVSIKWALFLLSSITFGIFVLASVNWLFQITGRDRFFVTSFSEGNILSTLTVTTSHEVDFLNACDMLISKVMQSDSLEYVFSAADFDALRSLEAQCRDYEGIVAMDLRK